MTEPLAVSVKEAKRHLGDLSTATLYRLIDKGSLERRKVGGRTLITMDSIKALIGAPLAA
ncbi:MAG: helix-turn-helix domain-containing protein [Pseudomonadota bacterium]|nr:helix-turn-helix domain-containing protein [Pseudomonadota bacterium]